MLDTFYSNDDEDVFEGADDQIVYEHMLGSQSGKCKTIHVPMNVKMSAILFFFDDEYLRKMDFKLSDGRIVEVGSHDNSKALDYSIMNFTDGQEIIGAFGQV